jgi:hypothetical protein
MFVNRTTVNAMAGMKKKVRPPDLAGLFPGFDEIRMSRKMVA